MKREVAKVGGRVKEWVVKVKKDALASKNDLYGGINKIITFRKPPVLAPSSQDFWIGVDIPTF